MSTHGGLGPFCRVCGRYEDPNMPDPCRCDLSDPLGPRDVPAREPPDEQELRSVHIRRIAGNIVEMAARLQEAANKNRLGEVDHWRDAIAHNVESLDDFLAPNGRHAPCGKPLDEDGECPSWCDQ